LCPRGWQLIATKGAKSPYAASAAAHHWHVVERPDGLAERARIVGFDMVELAPERDIVGLSALMAASTVTRDWDCRTIDG
jgi:hypothetical protein